jgi:hypothetical protein
MIREGKTQRKRGREKERRFSICHLTFLIGHLEITVDFDEK